ncbi:hypothetical protein ALC57_17540, partial [Trachymyrmex cornetzi]
DRLLLAVGQHPDLGLMCHAKRRTAMWRATLPTALCTSTFTCAAALIDARLCINTPARERLVRTRHVPIDRKEDECEEIGSRS